VRAPFSLILAETYLEFLEHNNIYYTLKKHITGYFRDADILLIYKKKLTDINLMLQEFKNIEPHLQFTIEKEHNNKIHF
jgi:hypothetical protein